MVQTLRKTVSKCLKKLKIELLYDPAIPLQDIYLERKNPLIQKDTCISVSIVALFTIAKAWRQPEDLNPLSVEGQQTVDLRCGI